MSAGNLGSKESQYLKEKENKEAIANFVNDHYKINSFFFWTSPLDRIIIISNDEM